MSKRSKCELEACGPQSPYGRRTREHTDYCTHGLYTVCLTAMPRVSARPRYDRRVCAETRVGSGGKQTGKAKKSERKCSSIQIGFCTSGARRSLRSAVCLVQVPSFTINATLGSSRITVSHVTVTCQSVARVPTPSRGGHSPRPVRREVSAIPTFAQKPQRGEGPPLIFRSSSLRACRPLSRVCAPPAGPRFS